MFTPASLLDIAIAAEARYKALSIKFPAGTYNADRNSARDEMDRALACSAWMEKHGHAELTYVGSFGVVTFKQGDRVRIKKGAVVRGRNAGDYAAQILERSQVVVVRWVDCGYVDTDGIRMRRGREEDFSEVRQPVLNWSGTNGYWRSTDLTYVEAYTPAARRERVSGCAPTCASPAPPSR